MLLSGSARYGWEMIHIICPSSNKGKWLSQNSKTQNSVVYLWNVLKFCMYMQIVMFYNFCPLTCIEICDIMKIIFVCNTLRGHLEFFGGHFEMSRRSVSNYFSWLEKETCLPYLLFLAPGEQVYQSNSIFADSRKLTEIRKRAITHLFLFKVMHILHVDFWYNS